MSVTLISFGFKYAVPPSDKIYDCRKLINPHNTFSLKMLDGRNERVRKFIQGDPNFTFFMQKILSEIENGRTYAFGCHGGKHRSVAIVEMIAAELIEREWIGVIRHSQLDNRDKIVSPWLNGQAVA